VFGALSDRIGRKPIIMAGCLIAALTFFPIFKMMSMHTLGAAAFIFVLNFLVLGTNLQTALIWAIGFGTFAFVLARHHTQR
jgi:MFS family permease